jgi:acyl-CoA hydrolase
MSKAFPILTPEEAAALVSHGDIIGFSGFTPAGAAKVVPKAIAARARAEHAAGRPFKIGVMTGASTGPSLDGELAKADAVLFRTPYQANPDLRKKINSGEVQFFDMHLSMLPQAVRYGFLGKVKFAMVEACDVFPGGEIVLTTSVGATPTFCTVADKVIIELNRAPLHRAAGFPRHLRAARSAAPPRDSALLGARSHRFGRGAGRSLEDRRHRRDRRRRRGGRFRRADAGHARIGNNVAEFLAR